MEVEIKKSIKFKITLNEEETMWLKNIMQNPFSGQSLENEDKQDKSMRKLFWNKLDVPK